MNKGFKIGCGCVLVFLNLIIAGIVWSLFYIDKNQDKILFSIKAKAKDAYNLLIEDGKVVIDNFFEKYNNKDFEYICKEMYDESAISSQDSCKNNLNQFYSTFGKELSYNISFPNAAINVNKGTNGSAYSIYLPVKFEKLENSYASFDIKAIESQKLKIYNVGFEINTNANPYKY